MARPEYGVVLEIEGMTALQKSIQKHRSVIGRKWALGLIEAGKFLLRESRWLCPIQIGNLWASGFVRNIGDNSWKADVVVGYTADYAVYVHENTTTVTHGRDFNIKHAAKIMRMISLGLSTKENGWFWRRNQEQAKFLEQPCRTKRNELFAIIRRVVGV